MVRRGSGRSGRRAATATLLLLAGCAAPSASPWRAGPWAPAADGPAAADPAAPPPGTEGGPAAGVEPVFCYQTLADVACYFERDEAVPGQLVAVYPRPTGDPATATYWRRRASPTALPAPGPALPAEP